jgi:hypothetical protein
MGCEQQEKILVEIISIEKKEEEEEKEEEGGGGGGNVRYIVVIMFIFLVHPLNCCVTFTLIFLCFTVKFYINTAIFQSISEGRRL